MKHRTIYQTLAKSAIRTNRELYLPYLVAGTICVAGFYMLLSLAKSETVLQLKGGEAVTTLLLYAVKLFGIFSLPFLIYTNAAIQKRRRKELGLYFALGMDKRNLFSVLFYETLYTYGIVILTGLFIGIIFARLSECVIAAIMGQRAALSLYVDRNALTTTLFVFLLIYGVVLAVAELRVQVSNPISLLHSENEGEKEPRARFLPAVLGVICITGGYLLSATTFSYVKRNMLSNFVGAAGDGGGISNVLTFLIGRLSGFSLLIGVGTLCLFVAGSVYLCKALKRRKSYYYKTAHFVSVSQLLFRMKRNGVSLAVLCVLSTVLLLSVTGAVGFFMGIRNIIDAEYPHDFTVYAEAADDVVIGEEEFGGAVRRLMNDALSLGGASEGSNVSNDEISNAKDAYFVGMYAAYTDGVLDLTTDILGGQDASIGDNQIWHEADGVFCVRVLSLETYNRLMGQLETLADGNVLFVTADGGATITDVTDMQGRNHTVQKTIKESTAMPKFATFTLFGETPDDTTTPPAVLVVPDLATFFKDFDRTAWTKNEVRYLYEYDLDFQDVDANRQTALFETVRADIAKMSDTDAGCYLRIERIGEASGLAGGILFLALVVTLILLLVTVLMMHYKQISEGYEDRRRFRVMQKVGMTGDEVRRCIDTQMRTVFFVPLLVAGVHLGFALPLVRLLLLWTVHPDTSVLYATAAGSFLIFSVVYACLYRLTTRMYERIVSRSS